MRGAYIFVNNIFVSSMSTRYTCTYVMSSVINNGSSCLEI